MMRWYAVHTRPASEAKAAEHLRRQGYEAYLPRHRRFVCHARRRIAALRPLFPRYLFVGIDRERMAWRPVLSTVGVAGMVLGGGEPMAVPDGIVALLQERERMGAFDELQPALRLRPGDAVRLTEGPFAELVGRLAAASDDERVVVLLEFLGRTVEAEFAAAAVEAA
ncbi:MAG TPA: transcriptional activator RfaH [Stellaceae bacterium]|nr:transcriptional activator RfaH [Stellaceae bacterium]